MATITIKDLLDILHNVPSDLVTIICQYTCENITIKLINKRELSRNGIKIISAVDNYIYCGVNVRIYNLLTNQFEKYISVVDNIKESICSILHDNKIRYLITSDFIKPNNRYYKLTIYKLLEDEIISSNYITVICSTKFKDAQIYKNKIYITLNLYQHGYQIKMFDIETLKEHEENKNIIEEKYETSVTTLIKYDMIYVASFSSCKIYSMLDDMKCIKEISIPYTSDGSKIFVTELYLFVFMNDIIFQYSIETLKLIKRIKTGYNMSHIIKIIQYNDNVWFIEKYGSIVNLIKYEVEYNIDL